METSRRYGCGQAPLDQWRAYIGSEPMKWRPVVKAANITL
jgi:hypothetical protein